MKKIFNIVALLLLVTAANAQQLDRSIRPSAAPAKKIEIKDAKTFTLANGLKVFVVEDHRSPIVFYSIMLDVYPALEGNKAGLADMFTSVIGTATKTRSKEQLNREIDLIGARISSHNRGAHAQVLKKHETKMLDLLSDIVLNPVFLKDELDLNREKSLSALKMLGDDASSLNSRVSAALTYGKNFPNGEVETEASLNNVDIEDLEAYHQTYFAPNVSRLVIVGDITKKEAKAYAEKYFGKWAKKNVPVAKYTIPTAPAKTKIAFIEKTGAVQSAIDVSYAIDYKPNASDKAAVSLMGYILGGGSSGRLFQNLREKHSYTYGVYSQVSDGELTGRFSLTSGRGAAQVKAATTDSAIFFIREEMLRMIDTPVDAQDLKDAKAFFAGSFGRALENPITLAQYAVNIDKYKLPKDYYKNYLKRLDAVTVADVQAAAKKYIKPDNAWIIIAGDKSYADGLKQFAGDHTVQFYDMNANPVETPVTKSTSATPESVINKYVEALGGKAAIEKVNDYKMKGSMSMMGQKMETTNAFKKPNYTFTEINMDSMVVQKIIFDGKTVKMSGMQGNQEITEGEIFDAMKAEASICPEMDYVKNGYKLAVAGIEKVNGSDAYALEVTKGETTTVNYYDVASGLKVKTVVNMDTPQGPMQQVTEMSDYKEVNGIKFAYTTKQIAGGMTMDMTIESIEVNTGAANELFQ